MARGRRRRAVSVGTVVMLTLTLMVLAGFSALLPVFTGHTDIRTDAANLAVAIDQSISQIATIASVKAPQATQKSPFVGSTVQPQFTNTPAPVVTQVPKASFTLSAAGSIKLNAKVRKALTEDEAYRFEILTDQVSGALSADLSIATLENNYIADDKLGDINQPVEALSALASTGLNALCLGYANVLDGGMDGLQATRSAIQAAGMTPYGVYPSEQERARMTMQNIHGITVALLSYQSDVSSAGRKAATEAERAFALPSQQLPTIAADIAQLRQNGANVVIVSLCWGKSGASSPTDTQRQLAQAIADAGADIILGTHSGTLQEVELLTAQRGDGRYHPVLCAYSLGNLFTYNRETRAGLASILLKANVTYDFSTGCVAFDDLTYVPTYSWRGKDDGTTRYRILLNTEEGLPDFVDKDQKGVMSRCLKLVREVMADSPVSEAQ